MMKTNVVPIRRSHIRGAGGAMRKLTERDLDARIAELDEKLRENRARYDDAFERHEAAVIDNSLRARFAESVIIYRAYRRFHSPLYSARTAWRCAFLNWSF